VNARRTAKVEAAIAEIENATLRAKFGRAPTPAESKGALRAALALRREALARIAVSDAQERERERAAPFTPQGKRINAINQANRKYAAGIIANRNKGDATRDHVLAEAKRLLTANPRLSKSRAAAKIGDAADALCGTRQAKDYLDKTYTAAEWRKLADAVTEPAN